METVKRMGLPRDIVQSIKRRIQNVTAGDKQPKDLGHQSREAKRGKSYTTEPLHGIECHVAIQ